MINRGIKESIDERQTERGREMKFKAGNRRKRETNRKRREGWKERKRKRGQIERDRSYSRLVDPFCQEGPVLYEGS